MSNAKKDNNSVSALIGVSSVDGVSTVPVAVDPTTGRMLVDLSGNGNLTIGSSTITGGTTGLLLYDNAGVVGELALATYPSLTELSYVKGVTSGIQSQLNGKQASGSYITASSSDTLTNKRVTPRILSAASYTTDTGTSIAGDSLDMFIVTAQAGDLKFKNPSGTPTDGQKLILSVASSTTAARALTWDTAYGATTVALPTTTAATTVTLTMGFIWSASKSLWQCVAVA